MIDGATPMRASVSANVLRGPATTMSHAPTRPIPPARTCPSITPTTGSGHSTMARSRVVISRARAAASSSGAAPNAGRLRQVGAGAERAAGVPEDHHPDLRVGHRVTEALMQLGHQRRRQRVAVVRRVQRQVDGAAPALVVDEAVHRLCLNQ